MERCWQPFTSETTFASVDNTQSSAKGKKSCLPNNTGSNFNQHSAAKGHLFHILLRELIIFSPTQRSYRLICIFLRGSQGSCARISVPVDAHALAGKKTLLVSVVTSATRKWITGSSGEWGLLPSQTSHHRTLVQVAFVSHWVRNPD